MLRSGIRDGIVPTPGDGRGCLFSFSFFLSFLHARWSEGDCGLDNARQACVFVVRGWFSRGLFARPMKGF